MAGFLRKKEAPTGGIVDALKIYTYQGERYIISALIYNSFRLLEFYTFFSKPEININKGVTTKYYCYKKDSVLAFLNSNICKYS